MGTVPCLFRKCSDRKTKERHAAGNPVRVRSSARKKKTFISIETLKSKHVQTPLGEKKQKTREEPMYSRNLQ
jgi:hypothetical protein